MKRNMAGFILLVLLFVSACGTVVLAVQYFFGVKQFQTMQGQIFRIQATLNAVQALAKESADYSRRNPAIDPILQRFEVKAKPGGLPQPQPANLP